MGLTVEWDCRHPLRRSRIRVARTDLGDPGTALRSLCARRRCTSLIAAFTGGAKPVPTWWLVVVGLLGIAAGAVTFLWPGITAILLVVFIGAWALVHGIFEIIGAIQLRKEIDNEWMLILGGVLSVLFGVVVLIAPGAGALGLVWAIAAYSILFGITFVALALRLRSHVTAAA